MASSCCGRPEKCNVRLSSPRSRGLFSVAVRASLSSSLLANMGLTVRPRPRNRIVYAILCICTIVVGLATRAFPSWLPTAFGKYPGDSLWAVMAFFGLAIIFPRLTTLRLACVTLVFCFAIETLKLCPWSWLNSLRQTTVGHLVLGRKFTWQNYFAYSIGVVCASIGEATLRKTPCAGAHLEKDA